MSIPAHGGIVNDTFTIPRGRGVRMLVLIVVLLALLLPALSSRAVWWCFGLWQSLWFWLQWWLPELMHVGQQPKWQQSGAVGLDSQIPTGLRCTASWSSGPTT